MSNFNVNFSGQFTSSQFATGETVHQTLHAGRAARERLDPAELQALAAALAALRDDVAAGAPEPVRTEALAQVAELEQGLVSADEPEPGRLARVRRWFAANAPELAESVASLLLGPLAGKLLGAGAGALAAALDDERDA